MKVDIITIFPEVVQALSDYSILGRAMAKGIITINAVDLRDYSLDRHRQVDDYPYGGGAGMVLKPEPLFRAVEDLSAGHGAEVIVMSPGGQSFSQGLAHCLAEKEHLIFICGHYEGIDQRVLEKLATWELSIGDYVLTGGELPAMVVVDAVARLVPGVLGNQESIAYESFQGGLLEHPHYTRPANFRGMEVPEILLSGNHQEIQRWRQEMSLKKTQATRPELLDQK